MKKFVLAIMMVAMLFTAGMASAADLWIFGHVYNQHGDPVPGATLRWGFITGYVYVTTDSNGYYAVRSDRPWCGTKRVMLSKPGYITLAYNVRDDSCCDCSVCIPPETPENTCARWMQENFYNFWQTEVDGDQDGVVDAEDNCPTTPNGPDKGTCMSGTVGVECNKPTGECGCIGECSLNQEDSDGDGIGDVCDATPFQATALDAPSFYLSCATDPEFNKTFPYLCDPELEGATETDLTQEKLIMSTSSRETSQLAMIVIGFLPQLYCWAQGGCNYECIEQAIVDLLNGPDAFIWWIYPGGKQPLPDCPDRLGVSELVDNFLKALFVIFFGDNFPEGELPWEQNGEATEG